MHIITGARGQLQLWGCGKPCEDTQTTLSWLPDMTLHISGAIYSQRDL